jgi:hypothetical protein
MIRLSLREKGSRQRLKENPYRVISIRETSHHHPNVYLSGRPLETSVRPKDKGVDRVHFRDEYDALLDGVGCKALLRLGPESPDP